MQIDAIYIRLSEVRKRSCTGCEPHLSVSDLSRGVDDTLKQNAGSVYSSSARYKEHTFASPVLMNSCIVWSLAHAKCEHHSARSATLLRLWHYLVVGAQRLART
jgi:hypothetical protein